MVVLHPPLLKYETIAEYKNHFEKHYLRSEIFTFDGIRVYFKPQKFGHAFYESSNYTKGAKDQFSYTRAERMDWIKLTLESPNAEQFIGWNKDTKSYEKTRRVSVVYANFVVVIEIRLAKDNILKGNFVTCYVADASIEKIRKSPKWNKDDCIRELQKK
ncbi:hypothetical protein B0680_03720 [Moraxella pluranimalium]|uniref:Uncharacterized protein n=1 Tax=Moraxella pluranimalium TaxID=470453 RepID=A0A1T0CRF5_9GAMM|nr:hypothetical protein B0680_03720 [Moraxella pluranimalium]